MPETSRFLAPDIECEHCAATIESGVRQLDGVHEVNVDLTECKVSVVHDHAALPATSIRALLAEIGFPTAAS